MTRSNSHKVKLLPAQSVVYNQDLVFSNRCQIPSVNLHCELLRVIDPRSARRHLLR
jgi:hypothetical protein